MPLFAHRYCTRCPTGRSIEAGGIRGISAIPGTQFRLVGGEIAPTKNGRTRRKDPAPWPAAEPADLGRASTDRRRSVAPQRALGASANPQRLPKRPCRCKAGSDFECTSAPLDPGMTVRKAESRKRERTKTRNRKESGNQAGDCRCLHFAFSSFRAFVILPFETKRAREIEISARSWDSRSAASWTHSGAKKRRT
jgi:hypothetical protein